MKQIEELYLIKNTGSSGDVYDMSRIKLVTINEIMQFIEDCGADKHTLQLKHIGYDQRIGFEIWHALADYKEYKQQCMMFIYSNNKSTPYINNKELQKSLKTRKLKLIRVLEYYDVPQLFIAEDVLGIRYLCLLYDIENNGELKVVGVIASDEKLNDFIKGHIDLLSMFRNPEVEDSIYAIMMKEDSISAERFIGILDDSMLPDEGYYYNNSLNENKI